MTRLAPGDQVICKIKDDRITTSFGAFDFDYVFDIIGYCDYDYIIYVPPTVIVLDSFHLGRSNIKNYEVDKRYIGSSICILKDSYIARVFNKMDGMACISCKTFAKMVEPNMPDKTFICWSCRSYPFYK